MAEQDANILEVLIGQVGKDAEIDAMEPHSAPVMVSKSAAWCLGPSSHLPDFRTASLGSKNGTFRRFSKRCQRPG